MTNEKSSQTNSAKNNSDEHSSNSKPTIQPTPAQLEALLGIINTVHRLRAPGGCPWDRAQTHQSLRQYLIEEAYEVLDVIDQIHTTEDLKVEKTKAAFREELGDLFMQVLLHSEMASESKAFDIFDVAKGLDEKLIRRHPHVFGDSHADSADVAIQRWEKEKAKEKANDVNASILDGVPKGLPTLQRTTRVIEKVSKFGFQWKDMDGPIEKVEEEWEELKAEIRKVEAGQKELRNKVENELGDLLFSLCNIAYLMKINPEDSLRRMVTRFETRFKYVERKLKENGKTPEQSDLEEMNSFWNEAKKLESIKVWGLTGGIASGKSTVAQIFKEKGIPIIDADQIAKDILAENKSAQEAVQQRFGTCDRAQLRQIVFQDLDARKALEGILHPLIQKESQKRILAQAQTTQSPLVVYEAALLVETGRYRDLSGLIVVEAPEDVRLARLLDRSKQTGMNMTSELAKQILASQTSDSEKRDHANVVFDNSKDLNFLREQVEAFIAMK
jgi:dephospho-CoA kinase